MVQLSKRNNHKMTKISTLLKILILCTKREVKKLGLGDFFICFWPQRDPEEEFLIKKKNTNAAKRIKFLKIDKSPQNSTDSFTENDLFTF